MYADPLAMTFLPLSKDFRAEMETQFRELREKFPTQLMGKGIRWRLIPVGRSLESFPQNGIEGNSIGFGFRLALESLLTESLLDDWAATGSCRHGHLQSVGGYEHKLRAAWFAGHSVVIPRKVSIPSVDDTEHFIVILAQKLLILIPFQIRITLCHFNHNFAVFNHNFAQNGRLQAKTTI